MISERIYLENFRNYEREETFFSDGVNIIYGKNGAGKTNLIEALYAFSYARSFRAPSKELIRHSNDKAKIALIFQSAKRRQFSDIVFTKDNKKRIRVNEIDIKKTSDLLGRFISVLFTPDELSLVKDGPEKRRKFLDTSIVSLRPNYFNALSNYNQCVKQKNALLKSGDYKTLSVWNEKIAEYGAIVALTRKEYINNLAKSAREAQKDISAGREELDVIYSHRYRLGGDSAETKGLLLEKIEEVSESEREQAVCLIGPHKDDIIFKINSFDARHFASQGQQRSIVLSLKCAQMEMIKDEAGEYPELLLDDVMSELDFERREFFTEKIKGKQVIISCTDLDNLNLSKNARLIKIEDGKICT